MSCVTERHSSTRDGVEPLKDDARIGRPESGGGGWKAADPSVVGRQDERMNCYRIVSHCNCIRRISIVSPPPSVSMYERKRHKTPNYDEGRKGCTSRRTPLNTDRIRYDKLVNTVAK